MQFRAFDFGWSLEESRDDPQSFGYDTPDLTSSYTTLVDATVIHRTLANVARIGADPASVMQSENDNVSGLCRP